MSREAKVLFILRAALAVLLITVSILVFGPFQGAEEKLGFSDKEAHCLAFYAVTFMMLIAIPRMRKWDVALIAIALGGLVEVVQMLTGRDAELMDWAADSVGVAMAVGPMLFESLRSQAVGNGRRQRRKSDRSAPVSARALPPLR